MSTNIITDPGAELDSVLWFYATGAERINTDSFGGAWCFKLPKPAAQIFAAQISQNATWETGKTYRVRMWVTYVGGVQKPLQAAVNTGAGGLDARQLDEYPEHWTLWDWGTFEAVGVNGIFIAWMNDPTIGAAGRHWLVDDIEIREDTVAIKLAERAVDAVAAMLLANLATELTAIETDRGDSISLEVPTNVQYYKRPHHPSGGTTAAHIEIYEDTFQMRNPYADAAAQRAAYDLPLTVRLTYMNRLGHDAQTMLTQMRRYSAGLYNCFILNHQLADADDATQVATVTSITPAWEYEEDGDKVQRVTVTLKVTVSCEETYA